MKFSINAVLNAPPSAASRVLFLLWCPALSRLSPSTLADHCASFSLRFIVHRTRSRKIPTELRSIMSSTVAYVLLVEYMQKKRMVPLLFAIDLSCAGTALMSQAVTRQVSSALMSLTSVFGMGTGGTSSPLAPAISTICLH